MTETVRFQGGPMDGKRQAVSPATSILEYEERPPVSSIPLDPVMPEQRLIHGVTPKHRYARSAALPEVMLYKGFY